MVAVQGRPPLEEEWEATGKIAINKSQRDSIVNKALMYVVVTSTNRPNGIVRGQQTNGYQINFGKDISLTPNAANASLSARGLTTVRLLSDGVTLYSVLSLSNLSNGDALTTAQICSSVDSSVVVSLYTNNTGYNTALSQTINGTIASNLQRLGYYFIAIKTKLYPKGLLWGSF